MIPKIIHYCWFGGNPKPENTEKYINSWKKFCPDYEIKEWNEANFDVNQNDYCREAFDAKKWAFVSDYVRLKVLYDYGGVYMDTDVEVMKPLEPLLKYNVVMGYESTRTIPTGTMMASLHNAWIYSLLKDYDNRKFKQPDGEYDFTTNVTAITKITKEKYKLKLNGKKILFADNFLILPFDYLCAKSYQTGELHITPNTYTIHHFSGSWVPAERKIFVDEVRKNFKKYDKLGFNYSLAMVIAKIESAYTLEGLHGLAKRILKKLF